MSKRRLVILSVVLEGRSQAEVAREFSLSEATVSRWVSRYRADGEAAFERRSRRPATSPNRVTDDTIGLIIDGSSTFYTWGVLLYEASAGISAIVWLQFLSRRSVTP